VWLPRFACPECRTDLVETGVERFACAGCGRVFDRRGGVWRFLISGRRSRPGGPREASRPADYYRRLPSVAPGDPHAGEWEIRRETYHHLLRHVLAAGALPLHVVDVGAGSGWLSHRLTTLSHRVVAVDTSDDEVDGLGAARHYASDFATVQADLEALPFAAGQFDLVVFNRSLHRATDTTATLERAHRLLRQGGTLAVMDSPMFRGEDDGAAIAGDAGFLTFARLAGAAERLELRPQFVPSRGTLAWRLRRHVAHVRSRRAPAAFGLWVAR
jgi:SAM-dependent methyltransferase